MKQILTTILFTILMVVSATAQENYDSSFIKQINLTPDGLFDSIYDQLGNAYALNEIAIDNDTRANATALRTGTPPVVDALTFQECSGSYFRLFFETGWYNGADPNKETAARNLLCQLLKDVSALIPSPLTGNGRKVNLWVRSIANMKAPANALAVATSFLLTSKNVNASYTGGIIDNTFWKTIISGRDAYENVAWPIASVSTSTPVNDIFFHGMCAFNFTYNWNLRLDTVPIINGGIGSGSGQYDAYTVMLHEITHALGFMSAIGRTQNSLIGSNNFSRYDLRLRNNANTPLLNHSGSISIYNFTSNYTALPQGIFTTFTDCSNPVNYHFIGGSITKVPTYSPPKYAGGSSLSHFDDSCYCPSPYSTTNNCAFKYYTMSFAQLDGVIKRYLKPEERQVLCDLGYGVNTVFGTPNTTGTTADGGGPNLNYKNYGGSSCSRISVWGINDGIANGVYSFSDTMNSSITLQYATSNPVNFMANDTITADSFEGLETVYGVGTFNVTSGNRNTLVKYSPTSVQGVHLLRYVPYNSTTGQRGNITYIYVSVYGKDCPFASPCNLIRNGGFEDFTNGYYLPLCWRDYKTPNVTIDYCFIQTSLHTGSAWKVPTTLSTPPNFSLG
jgi:hypothetical protein